MSLTRESAIRFPGPVQSITRQTAHWLYAQLFSSMRKNHVESDEQYQFREVTENEILGLHEGNFARFRIKPSQFREWQDTWNRTGTRQAAVVGHDL